MMLCEMEFVRTHPSAVLPKRNTPEDSGFDLSSVEDLVLQPGERRAIDTGWKINMGPNWEGQIRPRSGQTLKRGLGVLNSPGTIDAPFFGQLKVIAINLDSFPIHITVGERIAQLVPMPVYPAVATEVPKFTRVFGSRNENGYGSSGRV
jgi:dUTP pyrophosphatase